MIFYAIRKKGTNQYLPNAKGGYSRLEPTELNECKWGPRLFSNKKQVAACLSRYCAGIHFIEVTRGSFGDVDDWYIDVELNTARNKNDFEIVTFTL